MHRLVVVFAPLVFVPVTGSTQNGDRVDPVRTVASFHALDRNGDGRISRSEAGYDRTLSEIFAELDVDNDGFLSLDEYAALTAAFPSIASRESPDDTDGDES